VSISARKKATQNSLRQKSRASCFQNHALQFLAPTDKASNCVCGSPTPYKPARTSLAIAAVRRPLPAWLNETDKTRRGDRSRFARPFDIHRIAFHVLYKPLSRRRIVCAFLFSLHCRSCILFAKAGKSRVLRVLSLFEASLSMGSSTQKGTIFPFLFVLSTRFAFQVSLPVGRTTVLCD
jgi:hypothetical protein